MIWLLLSCSTPADPSPTSACEGLYGDPNENTGLSDAECWPSVGEGEGDWSPRRWDDASLRALERWSLEVDPEPLSTDPYLSDPPAAEGVVCALSFGEDTYSMASFPSVAAAHEAGAVITHGGACGLCSSLEDLAVYAGTPDLTQPVRQCGLQSMADGVEAGQACLEGLGFTPACASIWAYNVEHTRQECQDICLSLLSDPYHQEDGSLNACLQCDEDESGPVFKAVAGRTRRNSGLASALCRPCDTVWRIDHDYPEL